ncbi:MAG: calcium/sodium antiporter [Gammaproteobacteria bacterium]|nr:calcium/sodium antiporter [Gammaproteobacteria bacterium]
MLLFCGAILLGIVALVWGADRFVDGASGLARNLGISTLVIGLTVVGFGTSAPEILVAAVAAFEGNPGLGIGNALGSNIANVALVVGVTALVTPLLVKSKVLRREFPILVVAMVAAFFLLIDYHLGRLDGILMLIGITLIIFMLIWISRRSDSDDSLLAELDMEIPVETPVKKSVLLFAVGLVVLLVGSQALVWGATHIAKELGMSDLVIGLTIVAIGTSLPELAASVTAALKKEHDMVIGNIIGSNMFNLLAVLAMPGIISPSIFAPEVLSRDYLVMFVLTIALLWMAWGLHGKGKVTRVEGGLLLGAYFGYLGWLYVGEVAT